MKYTAADMESLKEKVREAPRPGKVIHLTEGEALAMGTPEFGEWALHRLPAERWKPPLTLRDVAAAAASTGLAGADIAACFDRNLGSFGNETGKRDEFAKAALGSLLHAAANRPIGPTSYKEDIEQISAMAYEAADAMMKARLA